MSLTKIGTLEINGKDWDINHDTTTIDHTQNISIVCTVITGGIHLSIREVSSGRPEAVASSIDGELKSRELIKDSMREINAIQNRARVDDVDEEKTDKTVSCIAAYVNSLEEELSSPRVINFEQVVIKRTTVINNYNSTKVKKCFFCWTPEDDCVTTKVEETLDDFLVSGREEIPGYSKMTIAQFLDPEIQRCVIEASSNFGIKVYSSCNVHPGLCVMEGVLLDNGNIINSTSTSSYKIISLSSGIVWKENFCFKNIKTRPRNDFEKHNYLYQATMFIRDSPTRTLFKGIDY